MGGKQGVGDLRTDHTNHRLPAHIDFIEKASVGDIAVGHNRLRRPASAKIIRRVNFLVAILDDITEALFSGETALISGHISMMASASFIVISFALGALPR